MASPRANPPVRAIVAADFTDPMRRPLSWEVKKRLRDQTERIEEKETGQGTTVWGNEQGLEFVDMLSKLDSIISANTAFQEKSRQERDAFQEKIEQLTKRGEEHEGKSRQERDAFQEKIREHEANIVKLTKRGEEHEGKIRDLTRGSKGYFDIRARFLCVYQRDHGKSKVPEDREDREDPKDPKDSRTIVEGNKRAHHGDAAMDAIVHRESPPGTFGDHTFRDLYYIDHNEALKLDDDVRDDKVEEEVFWVLNKRGTLVAAGKSFSKEVEEAFIAYMDGIYDDREVVAERRKKIWRMKS